MATSIRVPVLKVLENEYWVFGKYDHFSNLYIIQGVKKYTFVPCLQALTEKKVYVTYFVAIFIGDHIF